MATKEQKVMDAFDSAVDAMETGIGNLPKFEGDPDDPEEPMVLLEYALNDLRAIQKVLWDAGVIPDDVTVDVDSGPLTGGAELDDYCVQFDVPVTASSEAEAFLKALTELRDPMLHPWHGQVWSDTETPGADCDAYSLNEDAARKRLGIPDPDRRPYLGGLADAAELSTIIAALRYWQANPGAKSSDAGGFLDIATDGGEWEPLNDIAIDALCERLN